MFTVNPHNGHNVLSLVEKASPYSILREVSKLSETPFSQLKPLPYIGKTQPTSFFWEDQGLEAVFYQTGRYQRTQKD